MFLLDSAAIPTGRVASVVFSISLMHGVVAMGNPDNLKVWAEM
jgi:hypothetical protein